MDVFVNRIASHRELHQSEDLRLFLQAEEEVMAHVQQNLFLYGVLSILDSICFVSLSTRFLYFYVVLLQLCIFLQS